MANETYIYRLRADLGHGAFQISDLVPNTSRKTAVLKGQSGYLPDAAPGVTGTNPTVAVGVTTNAGTGLAAYLLANTNDEVSGNQLTAAICIATEVLLLARFAAGTQVSEAEITADFVTATAGAGTLPFPSQIPGSVSGAASVGTRAEFYKALFSTYTYALGAQALADGGVAGPVTVLSAADGSFDDDAYRQLYMSGAFAMSLAEGDLATWTDATFTYATVTAQCAVVYGDNGMVIS
jgi:hypothetical protein